MAHIFVIAGHGAGDPGAVGNGYNEAERVRFLAQRIKALGGDSVTLGDLNRNYYADNGISSLNIPKDWEILELHLDSASATAKGGHVIIRSGIAADKYDQALAKNISAIFPGRSNIIVQRSNLANPNRAYTKGYSYRLLEVCFITNANDMKIFNSETDRIARAILSAFGITGDDEEVTNDDINKIASAVWSSAIPKYHGDKKSLAARDALGWIEYNSAACYSDIVRTDDPTGGKRTGTHHSRLGYIDQRVDETNQRVSAIEQKVDQILNLLRK